MGPFYKPAAFAAAFLLFLLLWGIYNAYRDWKAKQAEEARYQAYRKEEATQAALRLERWTAYKAHLDTLPDHRFVINRITGQVRIEQLDRRWWTLEDFDDQGFFTPRWALLPVGPFNSVGEAQDYLDQLEAQRLIEEAWEPQQETKK